jgi:hypothetical protein
VVRVSSSRKVAGAVLLVGVLAASAVAPAVAHDSHKGKRVKFVTLETELAGSNEVPGPGDADGAGVASVEVAARSGVLCFSIAVEGIALPGTAAHVHEGAAGVAGPPVVTLEPPVAFGSGAAGTSAGCLTGLSKKLLRAIVSDPAGYYVNVHNSEFPDGALRGQLPAA